MPTPAPLLLANGVSYRYGAFRALSDVSLRLCEGEITAILGRNGAGKSTLLRCLGGWYRCEEGRVEHAGDGASKRDPHEGVVLIPDTPTFYAELTAWEHIRFISQLHGAHDQQAEARRILVALGLAGHETAYASSFSRGMQYKLALSVALVSRPRVLLLDEPFGPLDALSSDALWQELRRFADSGRAVLVSAHQMPDAALPDRFLLLEGGRIVADGTRSELMRRYALAEVTGETLLRAALRKEGLDP